MACETTRRRTDARRGPFDRLGATGYFSAIAASPGVAFHGLPTPRDLVRAPKALNYVAFVHFPNVARRALSTTRARGFTTPLRELSFLHGDVW